jgi:hypothetical protein
MTFNASKVPIAKQQLNKDESDGAVMMDAGSVRKTQNS